MSFNASKCVHVKVGADNPGLTLFLNGSAIPWANSLKYLGVTIQSNLKFNEHILNITKKANKTLGMIRRCLHGAPTKTCMTAFNTVVRPVLEYACQVWSPRSVGLTRKLESVNRRAVRWAYRLDRLDSVEELFEKHKIKTLSERRQDQDLIFLQRTEAGCYFITLADYINFNKSYKTRGGTTNPHFRVDQFKYSYFNRMREHVKCSHWNSDNTDT